MTIVVRLFAILRERAGRDTIRIELPEGATVADALDALALRPLLAETLARLPVRMAVNHEYAALDDPIGPGDELALIPPISGGAPDADPAAPAPASTPGPADAPPVRCHPEGYKRQAARLHSRVSVEPLSADGLTALVADPAAGAIVTFQGVTREVASLDYEAYREMAEAKIAAILAAAAARHDLIAAAAEHRVGNVPLGEPGVVVAVSAGHREEAFAGAREAIDRIKAEAPIWKRELDTAGAGEWVDGAPAPEPETTA
jgi:molybdopterin synthase catalytic subunit/molybdopterin converting factor small subunit